MPEIVPAAASTESASSSSSSSSPNTSSIAASVIADMEAGGESNESNPLDASAQVTDPADIKTTEVDPDDFDATPAERVDTLGRKRENAIPHSRVKAMIAKREAKMIATVAKELGITKAEAELQLDDVLGGVKERGTKLTDYDERFKTITAVEEIMAADPDRFMTMLVKLNPGYGAYTKQQQAAAVASAQATTQVDNDPEPEPDYDLGGGQKTYSLDGLRKLRAWERRQAVKEVNAGLDGRLKPFEDQRKQDTEREAEGKKREEFNARFRQRVERARKWPQFTEHEKEIMEATNKDNSLSFEDAYMQIVVPKLAGDRTKLRQELIAEQNALPKSTSVTQTATAKPDTTKPKTTADVARELIAQFEKA